MVFNGREVVIIGSGMTPFGKFPAKSLGDLAQTAVWAAIRDAGVPAKDIRSAYVANSLGGLIVGQEGTKGQTILANAGIVGIPVTNVENACASGTTALRCAYMDVALGLSDVALALGVEKLFCDDVAVSIKALATSGDIELARLGIQASGLYALMLRRYMLRSGATAEHFAKVAVKNSRNGSRNPYAQHRRPLTVEEILNSRIISTPLTLYMCTSISDGAAAAIVCSKDIAYRYQSKPLIQIAACALRSGSVRPRWAETPPDIVTLTALEAYALAGIGPEDVDVAEVHDGMAPAELMLYEALGLCREGEAIRMLEEGRTEITGDMPVNPSGGLIARGHPVAATGLAQVAEIVWQLRGEAGERQVAGPRLGLVQNSGGWTQDDTAACTVTVLKRV